MEFSIFSWLDVVVARGLGGKVKRTKIDVGGARKHDIAIKTSFRKAERIWKMNE